MIVFFVKLDPRGRVKNQRACPCYRTPQARAHPAAMIANIARSSFDCGTVKTRTDGSDAESQTYI